MIPQDPQVSPKVAPDIAALDRLLEAERAALMQGDLAGLSALLPDKEALMETLKRTTADDLPDLHALTDKVERNQALLEGALGGIREVANRMNDLRRMRGGLDTYGSDGNRQRIDVQTDHVVERRS